MRAAVVWVMPHWICGVVMRSVSVENGSGGSSPGCTSSAAQSMVVPSSRGGVPVFSRPSARPSRSSVSDKAERRRLADPAGRRLALADMDQAPQKSAGGQHHGATGSAAAASRTPAHDAVADHQVVDLRLDHREVRGFADRALHGLAVELAVGLGARPAHRRPFAAVEHAELDAARIGDAAHQPVQRIDFAHQMALAEPADRGIAGHLADSVEAVRDQRRLRAHARGCGRGLAAGMAAADDDDVECRVHGRASTGAGFRQQATEIVSNVSGCPECFT